MPAMLRTTPRGIDRISTLPPLDYIMHFNPDSFSELNPNKSISSSLSGLIYVVIELNGAGTRLTTVPLGNWDLSMKPAPEPEGAKRREW
jgi:hypothetical protein